MKLLRNRFKPASSLALRPNATLEIFAQEGEKQLGGFTNKSTHSFSSLFSDLRFSMQEMQLFCRYKWVRFVE